jgi:excisionase family DNA binding protein
MEATHTQGLEADLTVSQAARLARVSVDTIRRYTDDGTLPSYRTPKNARRIILTDLCTVFPRALAPVDYPLTRESAGVSSVASERRTA